VFWLPTQRAFPKRGLTGLTPFRIASKDTTLAAKTIRKKVRPLLNPAFLPVPGAAGPGPGTWRRKGVRDALTGWDESRMRTLASRRTCRRRSSTAWVCNPAQHHAPCTRSAPRFPALPLPRQRPHLGLGVDDANQQVRRQGRRDYAGRRSTGRGRHAQQHGGAFQPAVAGDLQPVAAADCQRNP
jgi:hypothetical protein